MKTVRRALTPMLNRIGVTILSAALIAPAADAQTPDAEVRAAVEQYNRAMLTKDLPALKALLAPDIVLYEHSVRNIGLDDVWEHHLKPEVSAFESMRAEFTDVRISATADQALVLRQYSIQATMNGKPIDARGNETMVWARREGAWRVTHIHYSHPCPRPPS
jgi:uncharacterized protein (TIGR02246 family)